jgi:UDP-2,3-diacylglucosamine pyrophosphatase LpxH
MLRTSSGPLARSRSVFISDLHLGFSGSQTESLLEFLDALDTQTLYLVGDVIDLSCAVSALAWPLEHHAVIRKILSLGQQGTRVVYVPGNHDRLVRDLDGARFGNVEIRRDLVHETADGRRFLVCHGDEFDRVGPSRPWLEELGGRAYGVLLGLDRGLNALLGLLGIAPRSLAGSLKQAVKTSMQKVSSFEDAVVAAARAREVDGLVCGHIHRAELVDLGGILYCNDGDWVESRTALCEGLDGSLSLVQWRDGEIHVLHREQDLAVVRAA